METSLVMKTKTNLFIVSAIIGIAMAAAPRGWAVDGKWNYNGNDTWSDAARWTNNQIANGIDAIAVFDQNFSAARTVTVDMAVTLGRLRYNDSGSTYYDFTLASSGGNLLNLQTSSGTPVIDINRQTVTFNTGLAGTQGFQKIGGGTLTLTSTANSANLSGKLNVTAGMLRVSSESCLSAYPATYVADQITLNGGNFMNNSGDVTLDSNIGITIGANGGGIQTGWGRLITINGVISGTGNLTFRSDATPGPISLNADNTYTGQTIIGNSTANNSWCRVLVNGSLHASSAVSVTSNGSLGGTGTVNGPVAVSTGGIVGPGGISQPGTLTVSNNVSATNCFLAFDLANVTTEGAGVNDLLQVNGDLTLKGTNTVSINALAGSLANGTYRLINYTGTGDFTDSTLVCDNPRLGATFDTATAGQVNMTIANGTPAQLLWAGTTDNIWNIGSTSNFLNGVNADAFYQGDAVTFDDSGAYENPVTMVAVGASIGAVQPASVTVNVATDFTLTSSGTARLGGSMGLYKGGPGTLTLALASYSNPNIYDGPTVVTNGTLKIGNARVLGSTNGATIVTNLGQFDTSAQTEIYEPMFLQGSGPDGSGVVVNTGAGTANNGLRGLVTLAGDVTLGGSGRFDIYGGGLQGNGYKLTKQGANEISLANLGETGVSDMDVTAGQLTILGSTRATSAGSRVAVVSNAVFAFWAMNNTADTAFVKDVALTNSNFRSNSGTNYHSGTVTLDGTNAVTSTAEMTLLGPVVGPGTLLKVGSGGLVLAGTNTYSGATLVAAGTLAVAANGTLSSTPLIDVASGATLDVSQPLTGLMLGSGHTLSGSGTVNGNVNAAAGSTLVAGTSPGTLTINGALNLSGASMPFELGSSASSGNDQIIATGVTSGGTNVIKILPLAALDAVNPYSLIANYGAPMPSGSETNFVVTTDSRYTLNLLPTDNSFGVFLQVQVSGSASSALLTWQGADSLNPTLWDLKTTSNWLNGATADKFYAGDTVVFDDTAIGTSADLVGTIQPGAVLLSNVNKSITIGGSGALVTPTLQVEGTGTTTLANNSANQFLTGLTLNAGTFVVANNAANDFGPAINLNAGTLVFNQALDTTVSSPLAGSGTLRKDNLNTLTLSGASTGLNPITVNNGILRGGSAYCLGDPSAVLTINPGASFDVNGYNFTNKVVRVQGSGYNGMGAIMNSSSTIGNWNAMNITLTGDTTFGGPTVWDLRGLNTTTLASLSTEGNPYNLTKIGSQRFSIVNTTVDPALANIDIQEGVFSYEESTTGLGNPTNTITVRSNAFLTFYRAAVPLDKQVHVDGGGNLRAADGTGNFLVGPLELGDGVTTVAATSADNLYLDGPISGPGGMLKLEAGTVSLGNSNNFAGDVTVNLGNFVISNSFAVGVNKTVAVNYSTTVAGGTGTRLYLRGGITTPSDVVGLFTALSYPGDYRCSVTSDVLTNTWAGPILLEGSGIVGFYRSGTTAGFDITGPIYGTNGFTGTAFFRGTAGYGGLISGKVDMPDGVLAITDNAVWQFSNPGNVWTKTQIAYGQFLLGADNAACATATLELGQSGTSPCRLDLNGFNQTVPSIRTVNAADHWITNGSATADSVFTFDGGTNVSVLTLGGRFVDGTRKLSLTVSSGSLTLLGNNTYKGDTLISGGTLGLGSAGTLASTPLITLASGATLDTSAKGAAGLSLASGQTLIGAGTINGSLTVGSGATLSVGTSIGTLTVTNALILAGTDLVEVNSAATPSSDLVSAGSVTYGGTLVVNNLGPAFAAGNSFKLFNAATYAGAFAGIIPASPGYGLRWDTSSLPVDGSLKVASIALDPTTLSTVFKAGGLDLSWPSTHIGWRLEGQTNSINTGLSTNWVTVPGSDGTNAASFGFDTSANAVFFRLVYP